jgi:hypothetical protein
MPEPTRERHRQVLRVLQAMNPALLESTRCFFAGGTRIVLELQEYRESADVDFLCASRDGYRTIRGMVTQNSFGELFRDKVALLREIRTDLYGIRTFLDVGGEPLKLEIIAEGRIDLGGMRLDALPVPVLDHASCFAEKLLANADRGRDDSTHSRDLVDLAYMTATWSGSDLALGLDSAEQAYGDAVRRELTAALARFEQPAYRKRCAAALALRDPRRMNRGLAKLRLP